MTSPPSKDDERIDLRVPASDMKRWRVTASAEGLQLAEWIRRRCNEVAVDQELVDLVDQKLAERRSAAALQSDPSRAFYPEVKR